MSNIQFNIGKDFLQNGGQVSKLDTNKDQNPEYTLNKTESGTSFEIFDFNSDGKKDMDLYYDKNGKFISGNFWDENGEIMHPETKEILAYLDQAKELRENAKKEPAEECKGINDLQEEMLAASQKMKTFYDYLNENISNNKNQKDQSKDKDISEPTFKFFG